MTWLRGLCSVLPQPLGVVRAPCALALVPLSWALVLRIARRSPAAAALLQRCLAQSGTGMSSNVALRTAVIDEAIGQACAHDIRQVFLGSGLATRRAGSGLS